MSTRGNDSSPRGRYPNRAGARSTLIFGNHSAVRAAEGDQVEYTFGRPVEKGEQTYDWYPEDTCR